MNAFDLAIIDFLNQFSQVSWRVDYTLHFISGNHLLKGGVLLTLFWWGWFRAQEHQPIVQVHLLSTLFGCFIAMASARALAWSLPFRLRPLHEEGLAFTLPHTMKPTALEGWSSFPSDNAVLFYALSAGMFYISKKVGIFALIYTTLIIALPRVYLGLHYPTDILAGAVIGIAIALLCNTKYFTENIAQSTLSYSSTKPEIFYPIFFIISYQIADMFENSRVFFSLFKRVF